MICQLNENERDTLFLQEVKTKDDGGFQSLMVKLQSQFDKATFNLRLEPKDLERIPRYAFDYKNGGWENRLKTIFTRHLGPQLGR